MLLHRRGLAGANSAHVTAGLFELMLYVPTAIVILGRFHHFNGTFIQNLDVMTSKKCFEYNHPNKLLRRICMDSFTRTTFQGRLRPEPLTSNLDPVVQSIVSLTISLRHKFAKQISAKVTNTLLFLLKKCENPLQCKGFSHFFNKK